MVALYNGLFLTGIYRASEFRIWDGGVGLVGVGEMGVGGRNGTEGWAEGWG